MSSPKKPTGTKLYPVLSTHINQVGYDEPSQTLHVLFRDGTHWTYHKVPKWKFNEFLKADSPGGHFHKEIRSKHRATKVK
jgi:KTSC domain